MAEWIARGTPNTRIAGSNLRLQLADYVKSWARCELHASPLPEEGMGTTRLILAQRYTIGGA